MSNVKTLPFKNKKLHPFDLFKKGYETHPKFRGDYNRPSQFNDGREGPRTQFKKQQRGNSGRKIKMGFDTRSKKA